MYVPAIHPSVLRRTVLLLALAAACARERAKQVDTSRTPARAAIDTSSPARDPGATESTDFSALSPVEPRAIPIDVSRACDSAEADVREVMAARPGRQDGAFADSFQGKDRLGCRLTIHGAVRTDKLPTGPLGPVEQRFSRRGWAQDLRYSADGPDGSDVGMRVRDLLCLIVERDAGEDDEDTTAASAAARAASANDIETIVECVRDVPSNADAGVPDSLWQLAVAQGIDSLYAIDVRLQYPPYLEGDFDGSA